MTREAATVVFLLAATAARAERLPIRVYTTADGISSTNLNCIVRDSRSFLWFCTSEGLSRFDGYTFTNYTFSGTATPRAEVGQAAIDFLETRDGDLWVASPRALCRFSSQSATGRKFPGCYQPDGLGEEGGMARLADAGDGSIWVLHTSRLFRFFPKERRFVAVDLGVSPWWTNLMRDSDESLWIGAEGVLVHRLPLSPRWLENTIQASD